MVTGGQSKGIKMEDLKMALKRAFATTYAFLVKAENFHWNVTGPDFLQYHELFGKIYDEVDDELDDFAERVRAMRCYVPASFSQLSEHSAIADTLEVLPKNEMLRTLYVDNGKVHVELLAAYALAEQYAEHGLSAFLSERIDEHRKHGWMLYSSMQP
jgi:starvation-inducible DNA-binding protein